MIFVNACDDCILISMIEKSIKNSTQHVGPHAWHAVGVCPIVETTILTTWINWNIFRDETHAPVFSSYLHDYFYHLMCEVLNTRSFAQCRTLVKDFRKTAGEYISLLQISSFERFLLRCDMTVCLSTLLLIVHANLKRKIYAQ